jgi:hypothetical protein
LFILIGHELHTPEQLYTRYTGTLDSRNNSFFENSYSNGINGSTAFLQHLKFKDESNI